MDHETIRAELLCKYFKKYQQLRERLIIFCFVSNSNNWKIFFFLLLSIIKQMQTTSKLKYLFIE